MENYKKTGENKNKLRTIYPKNHESFKNRKPRVHFTGSCRKEECINKMATWLKQIILKMSSQRI